MFFESLVIEKEEVEEILVQEVHMDGFYKYQRHFYDITRKFVLFGKDFLFDQMEIGDQERVLEVGCGTGSNLLQLSRLYPLAKFYGLDISSGMLQTAAARLDAYNLQKEIVLGQGSAEDFCVKKVFRLDEEFNVIFYSYTLLMIPDWKSAIDVSLNSLETRGRLYILDFADDCSYLVRFYRLLWMWLEPFSPGSSKKVLEYLKELDQKGVGKLKVFSVRDGHAFVAEFKLS